MANSEDANPGLAVDAGGNPVVDPTANVLDLVEAAGRRLDDLRRSENRRLDDLRLAGERHAEEIRKLTAIYEEKLRVGEAGRIDAIRSVDVAALNRATEVSATAATTLATQVQVSAETLRNQVSAAATAQSIALAAALEPIQKDIQDLRRVQYEAQGQKTQVVETQAKGSISGMWLGLIVGGIGLFTATIFGIAGIVITLLLR